METVVLPLKPSVSETRSLGKYEREPVVMGFPRQEYLSELPFPSSGDLPNPGIEPGSPALQADSLLPEPRGKPILRSPGKISRLDEPPHSRWDFSQKVRERTT